MFLDLQVCHANRDGVEADRSTLPPPSPQRVVPVTPKSKGSDGWACPLCTFENKKSASECGSSMNTGNAIMTTLQSFTLCRK